MLDSPALGLVLGWSWLRADSDSTGRSAVAGLVLFRIPPGRAAVAAAVVAHLHNSSSHQLQQHQWLPGPGVCWQLPVWHVTRAHVTNTHLIQQLPSIHHNLVRTSNTHFVKRQLAPDARRMSLNWWRHKLINSLPCRPGSFHKDG